MSTSLQPNERVIFNAKPHWVYLLRPAIVVLFGLTCSGCTILQYFLENQRPANSPNPAFNTMASCSGCILILAFIFMIVVLLAYRTASFTLTDRRVIKEAGILTTRTKEIFLNKVESVSVVTPLLGRLFGYGTVVVTGSGGAAESFRWIENPQEIRNRIQQEISRQSYRGDR